MKSTGIVRKVDELGRIVLPIELRRTLDIEEKDALEIYVEDDSITILYKDGTIRDISEASEILNVQLLSKKIRKYYLCYQRF